MVTVRVVTITESKRENNCFTRDATKKKSQINGDRHFSCCHLYLQLILFTCVSVCMCASVPFNTASATQQRKVSVTVKPMPTADMTLRGKQMH